MRTITGFLVLLAAAGLHATDVAYSPPVGGMTLPGVANTDNFVSVALARPAAWVGTVSGVTGNDITMTGAPGWGSNTFVSPAFHYVRVLSGAQKGHFFSITANNTNTLTVDNAGLNLSLIQAGDSAEIVPYWTLATLYPGSAAGTSFIASPSSLSRQTELLFFDATATGINRPASAIYYYFNSAWRKVGTSVATSFDNTIIYPDTYLMQRNKAATTSLVYTGRVQPASLSTVLEASTSQNDNFVALAFPVSVTLNSSGLATSGFTTTISTLSRKDELLWFDPNATGTNKPASAIYFYYNGGWRKVGSSVATDFGASVLLTAGGGFIIRKAANGSTAAWAFDTGF